MTGMVVALLVSAVLEVFGLTLAAVGFRKTWLEHSTGEQFLAPMTTRARTARAASEQWLRSVLRRPRSSRVVLGVASSELSLTSSVRAVVTWGPPPDPAADLAGFAEQVHDRINRLHRALQDEQHARAEERTARETAEKALRAELAAQGERIEGMTRKVAVGGLRLQVAGWTFVLLGFVLGAIAQVVQAWSS